MAFEIPIYRFRPEVPFEQAKAAVIGLNSFLKEAAGFKSRRTIYDAKSNVWIDLVEWESMGLALQAMEAFGASELCAEWVKLTDPEHDRMFHGEIIQEFKQN